MYTVIETEDFEKLWPLYWTEKEHDAFASFIAENPGAGNVIRGSGGVRKVRWSRSGSGKVGRCAGHLFQPQGKWRNLADFHLRQKQTWFDRRKHIEGAET